MRRKSEERLTAMLDYVNEYHRKEGRSPTVREVALAFDTPVSVAHKYLAELKNRGLLTTTGLSRGISTVAIDKARQNREIPILGSIACGIPDMKDENIEGYVSLSQELLGKGDFFAVYASGDSMTKVGIEDGDLVIVRIAEEACDGDIVVAVCNDTETTLKRYYRDSKRKCVRLHPENDGMEDMFFKSVGIQGVAVKLIKNLQRG